ncbi:polysaccharide deacetylase [Aliarcobacter trophiarum LMG 25534]|uniref:Polysaccharide deacetylase n=1 Tax=Aliarcobacter trophiarum LMG 25534 TaxID=1032241 RepID=A0AAD0QJR8_9BACT|nr:polysaccharide deacetylase family protein [Aliarcobacter trophiarum]AXK49019.1 polysaccharide deacetylase [Aliarcobacter trophiarum LMG 25534]RXI27342.1 polysaccharide deacetylase [Aliarcobacter trophiarum]RXJ89884.1 polysaccharide deacetylase [Aliarcobacter trophiarum LMG 25534]
MLDRVLSIFTILSLYTFGNTDNKIALLTFDDGPIISTKNIIEVVREEDIPVTMFFVGCQIEVFQNIYKDAISYPNILIANHTYSHANNKYRKFYSNPTLVVEDIKKANEIVGLDNVSNTSSLYLPVRLAGRNVFRLPTITKNDNMIDEVQREKEIVGYDDIYKEGYYIYGWDIEWASEKDGKPILTPQEIYNDMEKIYQKKLSSKENKVVLLMHDFMFSNNFDGKENLRTLIQLLKNGGWSFENIENY